MRKRSLLLIMLLAISGALFAQTSESDSIKAAKKAAKKEKIKEEWNAHFKFYGFARSYLTFDSRQSYYGNCGLYYFAPKDVNLNAYGQDLNATPELQFMCITTRLGIDVFGYQYKNTIFGAKIEGDFGVSTNGKTVTAIPRLRHAYFTAEWRDLDIAGEKKADLKLLMGQFWHPISFPMPEVLGFDGGCPFDIGNRSPQITFSSTFDKKFTLTASAIFHAGYNCTGPEGFTHNYMKYALTPEGFMSFMYSNNGFTARAGFNVTSIKPRKSGLDQNGVEVLVSDRMTGFIPYMALEYRHKMFKVLAKTMYAQAGEQLNLLSGYGVSGTDANGSYTYTPMQSSSTWVYLQVGTKYKGGLLGGYYKLLGTTAPLHKFEDGSYKYYAPVGAYCDAGAMEAWRICPSFQMAFGKFSIGLEYQYSAVKYGDATTMNEWGMCYDNLHWVGNHRLMALFQYSW